MLLPVLVPDFHSRGNTYQQWPSPGHCPQLLELKHLKLLQMYDKYPSDGFQTTRELDICFGPSVSNQQVGTRVETQRNEACRLEREDPQSKVLLNFLCVEREIHVVQYTTMFIIISFL